MRTLSFLSFLGLAVFVGGCAINRSVLKVQVQPSTDPASGQEVSIMKVTDNRIFELKPAKPSTPSLKAGDVTNKAITSRAVARKRNGWGMTMGDILLPEGRTVEDLVKEALTKAFRESGYKVTTQ